ncbi:MAG: right-handed parallel beta-helix repeat-containing protein [Candidatus Zixiibacteriota bacterium]|nr:MAG: right-handed parallel beta-helix repeat-containing protein [candidate division Zixibacteria bacterium]
MKKAIIITLIAISAQSSLADYHYASHDGSNTYPYTSWATAADSIQKAIDAAEAGDTIYVGSGLWEDGPYELWDSLALIGMGMDSTVLRGFMEGPHLSVNGNISVEGFQFENCRKAIEPHVDDSTLVIRNNRFIENHIAFLGARNSGIIENNIFESNDEGINCIFSCSLIVINNTFVGHLETAMKTLNGQYYVTNNIFHHNPHTTSRVLMTLVSAAGDTSYIASNLFYRNLQYDPIINHVLIDPGFKGYCENNTIIGFEEADRFIAVIMEPNYDSCSHFRNNIVTGFRFAIRAYTSPVPNTALLYYNDLWNNMYDYYYGDSVIFVEGNIWADPMFEDTIGFRLQMYSPCIDAGDPIILDPDGSRSDMGVYGGPGGFIYDYLDLAPRVPDSLTGIYDSNSIILDWRYNTESDFNRYMIYRDTLSGFEPSVFNLIAEPDTSYYIDANIFQGRNHYYKISAVDNQGNNSDYSEELAVVITGIDNQSVAIPVNSGISRNYPNPFNQQTTIRYYLADLGYQPAQVQLYIYNIGGQVVRKLVDERQYPGEYSAVWDGRGEGGESLSSGIYFARLVISGLELSNPRKIVLIK